MYIQETITTPVVAKAVNSVTYVAAGSALAFGMTANELGVIASICIGVFTFVTGAWINYHFRQKHYLLVKEFVHSGQDRRKGERRDDICQHCPLVKHRQDYDGA